MKQINYEKFQQALEEQRSLSFINLKNDIEKVKGIIEKTLEAALESSQSVIERDYHVSSL
ncbi:MAG: hypothetical protein ACI4SM_04575 [Candidatus Gastranaerophilaceae bacterium]